MLTCIYSTGEAAEFKRRHYVLRTWRCGTDWVVYIKLCYVEHNTVSPAASGLQHVTPTFKFCSFPSALFICLLVIFFPMKQPNNASLKRQIFSLWVTQIKIFCPLLFSVFWFSFLSFNNLICKGQYVQNMWKNIFGCAKNIS